MLLISDRRSRLTEMRRGDDGLCAVLQFVMIITFFNTLHLWRVGNEELSITVAMSVRMQQPEICRIDFNKI